MSSDDAAFWEATPLSQMSDEQWESLLPLMRKYVDHRFDRFRGRYAGGLRLPLDFGLPSETRITTGQNQWIQNDTKLKAILQTFHEACTQAQREVLGA